MNFKGKGCKNEGITLITLVVTIIVLLILAGVSINGIMGQDGVINQAKDAKTQSNNKVEEEQMSVKLAQAVGRSDITKEVMLDEIGDLIDTQVIIGNGPWIVKGKSGVPYTVGPDGSVTEMTSEEVGIMETATIKDKEKGKVLSESSIVTIKDELENYVRVPKGFKIAGDSGDNVGEGIVIEDDNQNQFVWVPVGEVKKKNGDNTETVTIPLGRYENFEGTPTPKQGTSTGYVYTTEGHGIKHTDPTKTNNFYEFANDAESKSVTGETYDNTKAKDIKAFVKSANTNGGYYIGRYEAGVEGNKGLESNIANTAKNNTNTEWTAYEASEGNNLTMVCQKEKQVWNYITQKKAASLSQNMYGAGAGVTSDLMNSYAWDTAIIFIQQCGNKDNSSNYANQVGMSDAAPTERPQTTGTNTLKNVTDKDKEDKQCNIYDMAGNVREWTTESSTNSGVPCVGRGSYYNGSGITRGRDSYNTFFANGGIGFRSILYL